MSEVERKREGGKETQRKRRKTEAGREGAGDRDESRGREGENNTTKAINFLTSFTLGLYSWNKGRPESLQMPI